MKTRFIALLAATILTAASVAAQQSTEVPTITATSPTATMHVTSIHKATDAEKTYHTALGQEFIETTIGNMHYTLESLTGWAAGCTLEIGKEYEVVKASQNGVVIMCPASGKRKAYKDTFNVTTVSEISPSGN
jgi:hypothetical protein